jgi:hypothetical protein
VLIIYIHYPFIVTLPYIRDVMRNITAQVSRAVVRVDVAALARGHNVLNDLFLQHSRQFRQSIAADEQVASRLRLPNVGRSASKLQSVASDARSSRKRPGQPNVLGWMQMRLCQVNARVCSEPSPLHGDNRDRLPAKAAAQNVTVHVVRRCTSAGEQTRILRRPQMNEYSLSNLAKKNSAIET